ncbi:MAG: hypothetical protein E7037_07650 [Verrucomicrobia bacterium]|nr:hypothetical protein [Verrucomicrobiota bacterium]
MKKIILLLTLIFCATLPSTARPFDGFARTPFFEEQLKGVEKRLGLVFPEENREYYEEGEFKKKFFGLPGWVLIEEKSKREYYALYSSRLNKEILLYIYWTKSADETRLTFLDLLLETYPAWFEIEKDYELADLGDYGVISKSKDRAYFACGNVCVAMDEERLCPAPFSAFSDLAKSLSALLRGEAEFLPEDTPEFMEIRKAYEAELVRRRRIAAEESAKREREWKEQQRKKKIENLKTFAVKPEQERDAYKKLETRFELLKNHLKPKSVPAGMHDPDAWKKLSPKTISPLFRKYKSRVRDDTPLTPEFGVWRTDAEIKKTKPNGIHYDVEIAHAKTFEDAWDWALYFRLKYSEDTEQRARLTMKQLARATHRNAFPNLGDLNISWRGRMTSSFYPEEKSAESLIIFIRGTTTVCVRSHHTDSSALPLARLLDKQLLEGDASRAVEFYLPENF